MTLLSLTEKSLNTKDTKYTKGKGVNFTSGFLRDLRVLCG